MTEGNVETGSALGLKQGWRHSWWKWTAEVQMDPKDGGDPTGMLEAVADVFTDDTGQPYGSRGGVIFTHRKARKKFADKVNAIPVAHLDPEDVAVVRGKLGGAFAWLVGELTGATATGPQMTPIFGFSEKLRVLILDAVKTTGNYDLDESMVLFEEHLTAEEYDWVWAFLRWVQRRGLAFGRDNIRERFGEFLVAFAMPDRPPVRCEACKGEGSTESCRCGHSEDRHVWPPHDGDAECRECDCIAFSRECETCGGRGLRRAPEKEET